MNFISLEFLLFFPLVFLLYYRIPGRFRCALLLAASYLFYMNGELWLGGLLLSSTAVSYFAAHFIEKSKRAAVRRIWLVVAIVYCLGCLFLFKREQYLVVGISFYTFQTLSYVLDVYMEKTACENNFADYALFVSFFPQLVAGPIERKDALLPQLKTVHAWDRKNGKAGLLLMLRGFFKKLVVADYIAPFVGAVYENPASCGAASALCGTLLFAVQIYCDFSGYTDIARGCARLLGIRLMENFDHPYRAKSASDFWRRWHISLTGWFRDYVYIPLGGNRRGRLRKSVNIMVVFLLSGLWHGLSLHYVIWGAIHGLWMLADGALGRGKSLIRRVISLIVICFSWVFFRAQSTADALLLLGRMISLKTGNLTEQMGLARNDLLRLPLVLLCLILIEKLPQEKRENTTYLTVFFMVIAIVVSALLELAGGGENTFIYFKF